MVNLYDCPMLNLTPCCFAASHLVLLRRVFPSGFLQALLPHFCLVLLRLLCVS